MGKIAFIWNLHCGQGGLDLEFTLVDRLALTWNLHCGQDCIDLKFTVIRMALT